MNKNLKPGWSYKKLDELGFVGRGKSKHRPRNDPSLYGGKYPFIQTGEVKSADLYISKYSKTYNEKGLAQSKLWEPGTLLLTIAANIADTAILKIKACFPDSIVGFIADPDKADVQFVKYYIDTIKLHMQSISRGTTQDNLSLEKIGSFDFQTPPLPIQRKIAAILSTYDRLIENNTRRIEILEEMARSLYREWFVKFRFPGHEQVQMVDSELGRIPEGWEVLTVNNIGAPGKSIVSGPFGSNIGKKFFVEEGVPVIRGNNLTLKNKKFIDNGFVFVTQEKAYELRNCETLPDDIVFTAAGTLGQVGIIPKNPKYPKYIISNKQLRLRCNKDIALPEYIYYWLSTPEMREHIINQNTGSSVPLITLGTLRKIPVLLPSMSVQHQFAAFVVNRDNLVENLERKNANLRQTRDLLLPRLISGEIDVENLDIKTGETAA